MAEEGKKNTKRELRVKKRMKYSRKSPERGCEGSQFFRLRPLLQKRQVRV